MATETVRARSAAEMPVVMPSFASMETVKAVPSGVRLRRCIGSRASSSTRSEERAGTPARGNG
jgi:hypothetical protein